VAVPRRAGRWLAALAPFLLLGMAAAAPAQPITVFAAASLKESLDDVARSWHADHAAPLRISYGASSALARLIDSGAPADLFLSADLDWARWLGERRRVRSPFVRLLANELVLIAPAASEVKLRIDPGFALGAALGDGRLALADPGSVPAGKYARAALVSLGVWKQVEHRLAPSGNVRSAMALVARAEAPLGIVYRTDALADSRVRIVDAFPATSHPPIVYALAETRTASPEAHGFALYAASPAARAIWARHGFGAP
jgi:molybdate transport system substrate-binding protein